MTKSKKARRQESSASEDDDSNTSSSESSSSSASDNSKAKKSKGNKKKTLKVKKSKKSHKKSSSSSSTSSEDSDDSGSGGSTKHEKSAEKHKVARNRESNDEIVESKVKEDDRRGRNGNERHGSGNHSKWDSPSRERERQSRPEYHGRQRQEDNRERRYNDYNSNRRQDRFRDDGNRGRDYDRGDRNQDQDRDRRRDDGNRDNNRNMNRDRGYNQQFNDRRRGYDQRNRRDNNERDDRRRDDGDSRGERSNYDRRRRSFSRSPRRRFPRKRDDDDDSYEWGKRVKDEKNNDVPEDKEKPNFGLSGKLTEDTNKVNGVVIKYAEPLEARKPKRRWRLYPFKGEKALPTLYIHRQSCYLIGRDRKVCDLPVDHPSCSKQHAALQYRLVPFEREDGSAGKRVRPYIIDLESANGTFLNNKPIEPKKYFELMEKDVVKFGFSSREYVMLHENSKEDQMDDDVGPEDLQDVPIKEEPAG